MAVTEVKKLELVAHAQCRGEILKTLRRIGSVHISDVKELFPESENDVPSFLDISIGQIESTIQQAQFCSDFVEKFVSKPSFTESLLNTRPVFTVRELEDILASFDLRTFSDACRQFEREIADNEDRIEKNETLMESISYWSDMDCPLEIIRDTATTRVTLGICEARAYNPMIDELARATSLFHEQLIERSRTSVSTLMVYHVSAEETVDGIFRHYGWRPVQFPDLEGTPTEVLERIRELNRGMQERNRELREQIIRELVPSREKLLLLLDHYTQELETLKIQHNFLFTSQTFLITGWVVASQEDELRRQLEEITRIVEIRCSEPGPDDKVPILLRNRPMIEPFALVTELYGRPQYSEFDPTPLLAPFFAVFFGICLGDGGYGLLLAIGCFLALKKLPLQGGARRLLQILLASGIATTIFGFLSGGIFGIETAKLPPIFKNLVIFNPTTEIIGFLYLSFAIGIFQILFGIGVNMAHNLQNGDIKSAVLDQVCWMLFIVSVAPLGFKYLFGGNAGEAVISLAFKGTTLFGVLIVLFGARQITFEIKNVGESIGLSSAGIVRDAINFALSALIFLLGRISLGILFFFKSVIDYFGDVLSYSRLMALGLATAFLGMVINQMAVLALGIPYGIGVVFFVLILVFGHAFNLIINCLSAFVHTLRLQYLEFFSKFFVGGGEQFKPFVEERKHTLLQLGLKDTLSEVNR